MSALTHADLAERITTRFPAVTTSEAFSEKEGFVESLSMP